jgi:diacylglycerol kinase (ATP)
MQLLNKLIRQIVSATGYSINGLAACYRYEFAFRIECALSIVVVPMAIWLAPSALALAVMLGVWFSVLIIEVVNSAVEAVVDRISEERHELSGRAKDLGSAAVFLAYANALLVWGIILLR